MANPGPAIVNTSNTDLVYSNLLLIESIQVTLSPGILVPAAGPNSAVGEQSFGLNAVTTTTPATGILAKDVILSVSKPTAQATIGIVGWRNSATTNDLFYISFLNTTNITQTPTASEVYTITVGRINNNATAIGALI
jgi:hypothetical protein